MKTIKITQHCLKTQMLMFNQILKTLNSHTFERGNLKQVALNLKLHF